MICGAAICSIYFESGHLFTRHADPQISYSCNRGNTMRTQCFEIMLQGGYTTVEILGYQIRGVFAGPASTLT